MNFLAHTLLGFEDAELVTGQVAGDFVRGSDLSRWPGGIETGIRLHRHLDAFTDRHPLVVSARHTRFDDTELAGLPRRFTGVVVDVLLDHWLAGRWSAHSARTLEQHAAAVQAALGLHASVLPAELLRFARFLERERVLQLNVNIESVGVTLKRLSRRSERFAPLAVSTPALGALAERLAPVYDEFFPELLVEARQFLEGRSWVPSAGAAGDEP